MGRIPTSYGPCTTARVGSLLPRCLGWAKQDILPLIHYSLFRLPQTLEILSRTLHKITFCCVFKPLLSMRDRVAKYIDLNYLYKLYQYE